MTATTATALVPIQLAFSDAERLALAGFLAGYRGLTREAYALDLRQFTTWCRARSLNLFAVRRAAQPSLGALLAGRQTGLFHLVCYLRDGGRVFETYWTKRRGAEAMDYSYALMNLTVYGRQERLGGLAAWLAATVLHHPDRRRLARMAAGAGVAGRTPHRPVAATASRALR
jgi:hypothetical protein